MDSYVNNTKWWLFCYITKNWHYGPLQQITCSQQEENKLKQINKSPVNEIFGTFKKSQLWCNICINFLSISRCFNCFGAYTNTQVDTFVCPLRPSLDIITEYPTVGYGPLMILVYSEGLVQVMMHVWRKVPQNHNPSFCEVFYNVQQFLDTWKEDKTHLAKLLYHDG